MEKFFEKHRPKLFSEIVLPTADIAISLQPYIEGRTTRPLLLYGPYGTGKTSIARLLPLCIDPLIERDLEWVDSDSRRAIGKFIKRIDTIAGLIPFNPRGFKIIVIDEADNLDGEIQRAMKGLIDKWQGNCLFIFTTNHKEKIEPGIISRSKCLFIGPAKPEKWILRCRAILSLEKITLPTDGLLLKAISTTDGDCRKIMEWLEDYTEKVRFSQSIKLEEYANCRPKKSSSPPIIFNPKKGEARE